MFVEVSSKERNQFLSQTDGCLIPGYTGHCPTLKFRYGKCYGASTKQIMTELNARGVIKRVEHEPYRLGEPGRPALNPPDATERGQARDYRNDLAHRSRKYIMGYTGYIPGLNFRYGKSYGAAADDSMVEFASHQAHQRRRREIDRLHRSSSAPKMPSIRGRDEIAIALKEFETKNRYQDKQISPEFPPIAGYTGHIPRLRSNDATLSQRFYVVARQGLTQLQKDRERRNKLRKVSDDIAGTFTDAEGQYTYGKE